MQRYPLGNTTGIKFQARCFSIFTSVTYFVLVNDTDNANYADDMTPYVKGDEISTVVTLPEGLANLIFIGVMITK